MMQRFGFALAAFLGLAVAACSGNDGSISVTPAASTLTANGADSLFTIKLDDGSSDGYSFDVLTTKVTPDGKDAIVVACALVDTNGNGKLDKAETLTCTEGKDNVLGPDLVGKEIAVELFAKIDGKDQRVGDATWTPK
jgi:hypothetical protein